LQKKRYTSVRLSFQSIKKEKKKRKIRTSSFKRTLEYRLFRKKSKKNNVQSSDLIIQDFLQKKRYTSVRLSFQSIKKEKKTEKLEHLLSNKH